jgi:hypothetical protein
MAVFDDYRDGRMYARADANVIPCFRMYTSCDESIQNTYCICRLGPNSSKCPYKSANDYCGPHDVNRPSMKTF